MLTPHFVSLSKQAVEEREVNCYNLTMAESTIPPHVLEAQATRKDIFHDPEKGPSKEEEAKHGFDIAKNNLFGVDADGKPIDMDGSDLNIQNSMREVVEAGLKYWRMTARGDVELQSTMDRYGRANDILKGKRKDNPEDSHLKAVFGSLTEERLVGAVEGYSTRVAEIGERPGRILGRIQHGVNYPYVVSHYFKKLGDEQIRYEQELNHIRSVAEYANNVADQAAQKPLPASGNYFEQIE